MPHQIDVALINGLSIFNNYKKACSDSRLQGIKPLTGRESRTLNASLMFLPSSISLTFTHLITPSAEIRPGRSDLHSSPCSRLL